MTDDRPTTLVDDITPVPPDEPQPEDDGELPDIKTDPVPEPSEEDAATSPEPTEVPS